MAKQAQSREERIKANALKALEAMGIPADMEAVDADVVTEDGSVKDDLIEKLKSENADLVFQYTAAQESLAALSESIATLTQELADKDAELAQVRAEISKDAE